ncbi:hypothetical protein [Nonomuraea sp. NEAU-A123]|uniref:hypothetical protein n=1 Tax=Nonomuraea sp. NEAU-A123 TaxID=2839649 RepID=UPI001BE3E296|nr:hypothetical protein [Nonomuraea sp. NEAU-A123]MBT2226065.1 hypothetical protein [Nonomuraea sp. NEAU-A123]
MRTENELSGALRDAADRAPELDLLAGVGERRRQRTRRRAQLLAAAAVVAVVGTSTVVARGAFSSGGGEEAAATSTTTGPRPEKTITVTPRPQAQVKGMPVAKLWPQAVFQMPAKNADGWPYRPITGISATEVLLNAVSPVNKVGTIEVYDTKTGTSRVVTEVPRTPGLKEYFQAAASTDGRNVVWYSNARKNGIWIAELWWAPLSGGKAKLAVTLTGDAANVDAVGVDGQDIVWSTQKSGVYRVPFTGGTPERVRKGDGLHLISWPWAGDAGNVFSEPDRNQSKIVNLADGTVTKVVIKDKMKGLRCGPVWCTGRLGGTAFSQRIDGARIAMVPGFGFLGGPRPYPILDRFLRAGDAVYDLNAGNGASIERASVGTSSEPSTILYWDATKGKQPDKYWVLNLAAVPPAQ